MPNKWIWLAIELDRDYETVLGAFASQAKAKQSFNQMCVGAVLKWEKLGSDGDWWVFSHGYVVRQCLFNDRE